MIIVLVFFAIMAAFIAGLLLGYNDSLDKRYESKNETVSEMSEFQKEYENFLNYDGSIQL